MPKALLLIIFAALLGGGLALLEWQSVDQPDASAPTSGEPASQAVLEEASRKPPASTTADLVPIASPSPVATASIGGQAKSWQVIPMNQLGQLLHEARVTAVPGEGVEDAALSGAGRTTWRELASGEWTLTIEAEGLPPWSKTVVLLEGAKERTAAHLGHELRIEGRVVDLNGDPVGNSLAYFLPGGTGHPERTDIVREGGDPKGKLVPNNGAVALRLGPKGTFKMVLPEANLWRFSLGPPGAARWTQSGGVPLKNGGPNSVTITVPARSSLRLSFEGEAKERPSEVVVFAFAGQLPGGNSRVTNHPGRDAIHEGKGAGPDDVERARREAIFMSLPEAERDVIKGSIARGEIRDVTEWDPGPAASSGGGESLLDDGWRVIRSGRPSAGGEAILHKLPTETDLRLVFVREGARIAMASSIRLRVGRESVARVALPPLGTAAGDPTDLHASVTMVTEASGDLPGQVGVVWE